MGALWEGYHFWGHLEIPLNHCYLQTKGGVKSFLLSSIFQLLSRGDIQLPLANLWMHDQQLLQVLKKDLIQMNDIF